MEALWQLQLHAPGSSAQHHDSKISTPISHFPFARNHFFPAPTNQMLPECPLQPTASSSSSSFPTRHLGKKRVDESRSLILDSIRHSLLRQGDSIIFSLLERAQYAYNINACDHDAFFMDGFNGFLVDYLVWETEMLHAQVIKVPRQWKYGIKKITIKLLIVTDQLHFEFWWEDTRAPDEHAFFPAYLPEPISTFAVAAGQEKVAAVVDYERVKATVKKRVEMKARTYGQVVKINENGDAADPVYKIQPSLVANLYGDWIMPLKCR